MVELLTGEALFGSSIRVYVELSIAAKIVVAVIFLSITVALVMTIVSLISVILSGAPFIATPGRLMRKIVALAEIQPGECVYDLGCGDGRFLIEANKRYGARAVGIDISPLVCNLARLNIWLKRAHVVIQRANFKKYDFSDADVIFCYLVPDHLAFLGEQLTTLKKGCRIVSRRFEIPGYDPWRRVEIEKRFGHEPVFIYRV